MTKLTSQFDEWGQLYPCLSQLAIALTLPVSYVNCERDFSAVKRVKTDLRSRLQGEHLAASMRLSINCPPHQGAQLQQGVGNLFPAQKNKVL
nr:zinc finger protein 862-like [Salvelinus alpinus]